MLGWRKRIGYIGPTVLEVVPYEFYRFAPDGIGLVGVTCRTDDWSSDQVENELVRTAAAYLGTRAVDFVIHGGGPLVAARGTDFEETIVRDIEAAARVPATTGVRAAMAALRHMEARRIAIASPYADRHNQTLSAYLELHDFALVRVEGIAPADIRRFAADVIARAPRCDALYLPSPQWQAAQVVDVLEREIGMPAIAYTHAAFFAAFKALGVKDPIDGHGQLLASLAGPAR